MKFNSTSFSPYPRSSNIRISGAEAMRKRKVFGMDAAGTSDGFLASHCRLVTRDLDEARQRVGRMWEWHESYLRRGRTYGLRWHQADLPHASLSCIESQSPIRVVCGPISNVFRFTMLEEGCVRYCIDGRETEAMPSRGVVYCTGAGTAPGHRAVPDVAAEFSWLLCPTGSHASLRQGPARLCVAEQRPARCSSGRFAAFALSLDGA